MSHLAWIDPRIRSVRADSVRSHLLKRGWQLQPYPGSELLVFGGRQDDDGQPIVQVVPSSERLRDFPLRLAELIAALSVIEDRPAGDILTDLLNEPAAPTVAPAPAPDGASTPASRR